MNEKLQAEVEAAIKDHGEHVVLFAFGTFTKILLPICKLFLAEQAFNSAVREAGLTEQEAYDALKLMASVKAATDQHAAWRAGEVLNGTLTLEGWQNIMASVTIGQTKGN